MNFNQKLQEAFTLAEQGFIDEAKTIYRELFSSRLTDKQKVDVRFNYGYLLIENQQIIDAIINYEAALHLAQNLRDKEIIAQSYHQLGRVHRMAEQFTKAAEYFQKERRYIERNFPDHQLFLAANEYEFGYTKLMAGDLKQAKIHLDQCLQYALKSEDYVMKACAYRGLGDYYKEKNNVQKAEEMYLSSLQHFTQAKDEMGIREIEEKIKNVEINSQTL